MNSDAMVFIDTPFQLNEIRAEFSTSQWLAVDTEFLRETTYYPKFCLLQIASPNQIACIDPLAFETLDPLKDLLFNNAIIKVFHAARQDLEIFYQLFEEVPYPVFDTQIAAPLLGFGDQIGYAALVSKFTNIRLDKAHSRTDWTVRPLSAEQLQYAFDDVYYLGQIFQKMFNQLKQLNRLDWLSEDFNALIDPKLYENNPSLAWQRIRGSNRMTALQIGSLQSLAEWREITAQTQDKPRNWVIKDEVLVDIALSQPSSLTALEKIRGLPNRTIKNHGKKLCDLVRQAKPASAQTENGKLPHLKTPNQAALLDTLTAIVRLKGAENSLNPAILASRKDLEQLLLEKDNGRLLSGWRKNLIGKELLAMIAGERSLSVKDGVIKIKRLRDPEI